MSKMILWFLIVWTVIMAGMYTFRAATGKQRWEFTKMAVFGLLCACVSMAFLLAIVMLF